MENTQCAGLGNPAHWRFKKMLKISLVQQVGKSAVFANHPIASQDE